MGASAPGALRQAVDLFNAQAFFACHELLEDALWRPAPPGPTREAYQGLIQAAVGYHHAARGNEIGARRLLTRARNRLRMAIDADIGVGGLDGLDLAAFLHALSQDAQALAQSGAIAGEPPRLLWRDEVSRP